MKAPNYIVGLFLATAITVPSFVKHSEKRRLQTLESFLENQTSKATALSAKNRHLSEVAARFEQSKSVTEAQTEELLQVRNDIASNRRSLQEVEAIRSRIARLRDQLTDAASEAQFGPQIDTTLVVDEIPVRTARVERLKRWLEQTPSEKIPELQLISDDRWMYRAGEALIVEQDYRSMSAMLRADGEGKMSTAIADALKQFAKNGGGPFPADVEALKPYFSAPIDDSMLQRWQVVPAKTLIPSLAETGGDWVITQRAPVNRRDSRWAIGLTGSRGTLEESRWDPVP